MNMYEEAIKCSSCRVGIIFIMEITKTEKIFYMCDECGLVWETKNNKFSDATGISDDKFRNQENLKIGDSELFGVFTAEEFDDDFYP